MDKPEKPRMVYPADRISRHEVIDELMQARILTEGELARIHERTADLIHLLLIGTEAVPLDPESDAGKHFVSRDNPIWERIQTCGKTQEEHPDFVNRRLVDEINPSWRTEKIDLPKTCKEQTPDQNTPNWGLANKPLIRLGQLWTISSGIKMAREEDLDDQQKMAEWT